MDIFLKSGNFGMNFIPFIIFAFVFSVIMIVAHYLAKSFINAEMDKLDISANNFDRCMILISGVVISVSTVIICMVILNFIISYYYNFKEIFYLYTRLMIIFSAILTICYTLAAPKHSNHRIMVVSNEQAKIICFKSHKILIVSFVCSMLYLPMLSVFANTKHKLTMECTFIGSIIMYCFMEIFLSRKMILELLKLRTDSNNSISKKIIIFISGKFSYICLICMFAIAFSNIYESTSKELLFLQYINNTYLFLFGIFSFQGGILCIVNQFIGQIEKFKKFVSSKKLANRREKNLIWICDVIVLSAYVSSFGFIISYCGMDIKKYTIHNGVLTVFFILFITSILFKGFQEYKEIIIDEAKKRGTEYHGKLRSFLPAITAVFYILLFSTSSMVMLSSLGVNITPILTSFSIFSAAIGLAATDIIKSFLHGIVLLVERNIFVGNVVKINDMVGIIEKLSVRVIYLRDIDGKINIIPYSNIGAISNYSKGCMIHSSALPIVSIDDVDIIKQILIRIVEEMREEEYYKDLIISDVIVRGIQQIDLTGLKMLWEIKTTIDGKYALCEIHNRLAKECKKRNVEFSKIENVSISC